MELYKKMYLCLFHAITDALERMSAEHPAADILRRAQQQAEEIYLEAEEEASARHTGME